MGRTVLRKADLPALAGTAAATCFLTYILVVPAVWIDDIGAGGFSFDGWTLLSTLASLGGLIASAVFAVPLGFVGAFLFLALSIGQLDRSLPLRTFILLGAIAGLAHTGCGFGLRLLDAADATPDALELVMGVIAVLGGFALTNLSRTMLIAAFVAAPVAGAVAGWLYGGLLKLAPAAPEDI